MKTTKKVLTLKPWIKGVKAPSSRSNPGNSIAEDGVGSSWKYLASPDWGGNLQDLILKPSPESSKNQHRYVDSGIFSKKKNDQMSRHFKGLARELACGNLFGLGLESGGSGADKDKLGSHSGDGWGYYDSEGHPEDEDGVADNSSNGEAAAKGYVWDVENQPVAFEFNPRLINGSNQSQCITISWHSLGELPVGEADFRAKKLSARENKMVKDALLYFNVCLFGSGETYEIRYKKININQYRTTVEKTYDSCVIDFNRKDKNKFRISSMEFKLRCRIAKRELLAFLGQSETTLWPSVGDLSGYVPPAEFKAYWDECGKHYGEIERLLYNDDCGGQQGRNGTTKVRPEKVGSSQKELKRSVAVKIKPNRSASPTELIYVLQRRVAKILAELEEIRCKYSVGSTAVGWVVGAGVVEGKEVARQCEKIYAKLQHQLQHQLLFSCAGLSQHGSAFKAINRVKHTQSTEDTAEEEETCFDLEM